jgi:cytochrome c1
MIEGRGGEAVVSAVQAAQFKNELAQRDVVYLQNAIAAKQSDLVTESRPPTKEETDQLRLLTDMVKYLEKQVGITQGQADDERRKQDEREQFEQIQRVQNLNYQEGGYYQY